MKDFKLQYLDWLNANIQQSEIREGVYRITLPYLNRSNDMMDIYILEKKDGFILTDDGATIHNLDLVGVSLSKGRERICLTRPCYRSAPDGRRTGALYRSITR